MSPSLDWTELDDRAVDTARVLAMDAVQKVGNGHPGTAMSLAPAAYLLFQKVMRHDPADPSWIARDRFVLSCGHSSLTLYIQLYLGGFGLGLDDLKALRTWGSRTPGHPEHGHTAGVETTTGPLGQGVANAVGMAMAARRERGLLDPDAEGRREPVRPHGLRHLLRRRPPGGRERRGLLPRRAPAARQPRADLRRQQDLDRGRHRGRVQRGRLRPVRRLRLARAERGLDQRRHGVRRGRPGAVARHPARPEGDRPPELHQPPHDHRLAGARTPRTPAARTARPSATTRSRPPRRSWASTPRRPSRSATRSSPTPAACWSAAARPAPPGTRSSPPGRRRTPSAPSCSTGSSRSAACPTAGADALPTFEADAKGVATRKASGEVLSAIAPVLPELWGGSADLAGSNNTTPKGEPSFLPGRALDQEVLRQRVRPRPALRHPRARHGLGDERHRPARRHPRVRRHVPRLLRLHAPGGPPRGAHGPARDLRVDPRLHRSRRGRPDPPAGRAPRRAARHPRPRRSSAPRTPTRPSPPGRPCSRTPAAPRRWR